MKPFKLLVIILLIMSCSSSSEETIDSNGNNNSSGNNNNTGNPVFTTWSIPIDEIFDGAGREGIPSIDNPDFISGQDTSVDTYMNPDDLVIGIKVGSEIRAYPHRIMDWHEIVNDNFNGEKITINYCPLTRTAFAWKHNVSGSQLTFGVSGLLYNSNLILYDRETNSNWSQMKIECVNGSELGDKPTLLPIVETNWETWRNMYPETKILSDEQGFARNYQNYPYGNYLDSDEFLFFPVNPLDSRLPRKERVHTVIISGVAKAYQFDNFTNGNVFKDTFLGNKLLLVGNDNVIKSFILPQDLLDTTFTYSYNNGEEFFTDDLGNKWSISGNVIEGPMLGRLLFDTNSVTGFWFSVASFYVDAEIY